MSTRTNLRPQVVIPSPQASPANTGSMAASITSAPTVMQSLSGASYSISWSGTTPVGTASVQVSNDFALNPEGGVANAGTWSTITFQSGGSLVSSFPITGNTGNGFLDIQKTIAYAIRFVYTATSGTGNLTVIFNGKVA